MFVDALTPKWPWKSLYEIQNLIIVIAISNTIIPTSTIQIYRTTSWEVPQKYIVVQVYLSNYDIKCLCDEVSKHGHIFTTTAYPFVFIEFSNAPLEMYYEWKKHMQLKTTKNTISYNF